MAYSETLAARIRHVLNGHPLIEERKMFGGLAFLVQGNMSVGVIDDHLVLRLGEEGASAALKEPHTKLMDFTGTPMKSMVYVFPEGYTTDEELLAWVKRGVDFAMSLKPKG